MMLILSLPTNQDSVNIEDCLQKKQFYYHFLPLKQSTRNSCLNSLVTAIFIKQKKSDKLNHSKTDFSSKRKLLADEPRIVNFVETGYKKHKTTLNVSCSRDDEICACAQDN